MITFGSFSSLVFEPKWPFCSFACFWYLKGMGLDRAFKIKFICAFLQHSITFQSTVSSVLSEIRIKIYNIICILSTRDFKSLSFQKYPLGWILQNFKSLNSQIHEGILQFPISNCFSENLLRCKRASQTSQLMNKRHFLCHKSSSLNASLLFRFNFFENAVQLNIFAVKRYKCHLSVEQTF